MGSIVDVVDEFLKSKHVKVEREWLSQCVDYVTSEGVSAFFR